MHKCVNDVLLAYSEPFDTRLKIYNQKKFLNIVSCLLNLFNVKCQFSIRMYHSLMCILGKNIE